MSGEFPGRILFLNPVGVIGGAERLLLDLLSSIQSTAPAIRLRLVCATDGPLLREAQALGVETELVRMPESLVTAGDSGLQEDGQLYALFRMLSGVGRDGREAAAYVRALRRSVSEFGPDLIHSNGIKTHLLAPMISVSGAPIVWHIHDFLGQRRLMRRVLRLIRRRASLAIANSFAVGEDVQQTLPSLPLRVVRNGVDTERFSPGPADGSKLDELAGLPPAPAELVRVGLVATFARWKGQDTFLRAAGRLLALDPSMPVRFYVIGGPIYRTADSQFDRAELVQLANELGLQGRVGFVGFQSEIERVYRSLDVVVHASVRAEPFGLTIAEAMACGKPVVVSAAGGASELFTHRQHALGFAPGNFVELSTILGEVVEDPLLRQRLGAQARLHAVQNFGRERLGPEVLAAYRAISRSTGAAGSDKPQRA